MHRGHFETEYWNPEILQTQTAIRQRCVEFVTRGRTNESKQTRCCGFRDAQSMFTVETVMLIYDYA